MELNFKDEDCCSFVVSTKGGNNSMQSSSTMTTEIHTKEANTETREEGKEMAIQCDGLGTQTAQDVNEVNLMAFLRSKMSMLEEVFREQNNIENTTGNTSFLTMQATGKAEAQVWLLRG